MTFAGILFLTAFLISAVAEYYAIAGLVAIFASNPIGAIILGCALAAGKLVAASWLLTLMKPISIITMFRMVFLSIALGISTIALAGTVYIINKLGINLASKSMNIILSLPLLVCKHLLHQV